MNKDLSSNPESDPRQGEAQAGLVWVFAYGSLMWSPGFLPQDSRPARLFGWHRSMCILSTIYRGTPERPGLVLGLDRGGSCVGRALAVAWDRWPEIKAQLDERELVTGVYDARWLDVRFGDGQRVPAYAFVVRHDHEQYWSGPEAEAVRLVRQGAGRGGRSRDYLAMTVERLDQAGIRRGALHRLLGRVDGGS